MHVGGHTDRAAEGMAGGGEVPAGDREADIATIGRPPRASHDLRQEHVLLLRMLKVLEAAGSRLAAGEGLPAEDRDDIVNFLRVFIDRRHHGKEERVLFPAVLQGADDETRGLIEELLVEHVEGRTLVAALASAAGTDPVLPGEPEKAFESAAAQAAIHGYVELIRPHVAKEEKRVFPVADRILSPELQETIQGEYDRIEEEMNEAAPREDYEAMVNRLKERYLPRHP